MALKPQVPLGDDLVVWMELHGVDGRPFAEAIGVSPRTITRWRQGDSKPRFDELERFANYVEDVEARSDMSPVELVRAANALAATLELRKRRARTG